MVLYFARLAAGLLAGFLGGLISYVVYRKHDESHELMKMLLYRPLGIPEDHRKFKKRTYLLFMSFTGLVYGFAFEALRMGNLLPVLQTHIQNITFFAFSIGLSVVMFQVLLHLKVDRITKKMAEEWLIIGLVFGFFLGLFFNLVSFFVIGPLMI